MSRLLVLILLIAATLPAFDCAALASPRPQGWCADPALRLAGWARERVDAVAQSVQRDGRGELAVAVVPDCGGADPRQAGLALFNRWGVGRYGRNDGVLLLLALQERRVEILLGDGIDNPDNTARCRAIVDEVLLARLRAGDLDGAVTAGAEACARQLFAGAPASLPAVVGEVPSQPMAPSVPAAGFTGPVVTSSGGGGGTSWWPLALLGGGGAVGGGLWWRRQRRHATRLCPVCRATMRRLDESADDAHLDPAEKAEEKVGSADWDVWVCEACSHAIKLRYGAWFTSYHRCPQCSAATASDHSTTLSEATTLSGGLVRVDTRCAHCGYHDSTTRSTPRKSSSGGCGIGHSRSSGGGGSFGGGRSSGGGAGGSW